MTRDEQFDKNLDLVHQQLLSLLSAPEDRWPVDGSTIVFAPGDDPALTAANRAALEIHRAVQSDVRCHIGGSSTQSNGHDESTLTYELWHLAGSSMIDSFKDRGVALEAVQAYLEANEADQVALIVRDGAGSIVSSPTGPALIEWATGVAAAS